MSQTNTGFLLFVRSGTYEASLEPRKVYRVVDDSSADARSPLRVIDDSGEDYLFPADLFVPIDVPEEARPVFVADVSV